MLSPLLDASTAKEPNGRAGQNKYVKKEELASLLLLSASYLVFPGTPPASATEEKIYMIWSHTTVLLIENVPSVKHAHIFK